ncbi:MAG: hypothetical protein J5898_06105 [Lachnospiraceae bacterium]|nr:hypothetical protein [Lachnospiraceae bacterium]
MRAEYKGLVYNAALRNDAATLMTFDTEKKLKGFETKKEFFNKTVKIDDPLLDAVYELHYWVKYCDSIEKTELWMVDEGRSHGAAADIEKDEIVITVNHDPLDDSWIQDEKGTAYKKIQLSDCTEYMIEKKYAVRNGILVGGTIERTSVPMKVFIHSFIANRRENL